MNYRRKDNLQQNIHIGYKAFKRKMKEKYTCQSGSNQFLRCQNLLSEHSNLNIHYIIQNLINKMNDNIQVKEHNDMCLLWAFRND